MKAQFVVSLVLGIMMSNASAHDHGIRSKHRSNDPARRIHHEVDEISIPPSVKILHIPNDEEQHQSTGIDRRNESTGIHLGPRSESSTSTTTNNTTNSTISNSTSTSTSSLPLPPTTVPTSLSKPIPVPLDLSISNSLSGGCMIFLSSLITNDDFTNCLPFSLLLTTSTSYSKLVSTSIQTGNFSYLNDLLKFTLNPKPSNLQCDNLISSVQSSLLSNKNCGGDNNNPIIQQTKLSLNNYKLMKTSSSLLNDQSGSYCYLDALYQKKPDDLYLWSLPNNIPLPSSSKPTCSSCSRLLLNTYMENTSSAIFNTTLVKAAVERVNNACGSSFVNLSAVALSSSAGRKISPGFLFDEPIGWMLGLLISFISLICI
ncbi:uncharacterized protein L201_004151 [Kwoniella dendrophila CBS 6074]|uniref:DUF7729 domain-containing protein n=1 Tax=Kwoniella dendrophila CBS 6074 TaxID=1295534 RepID=A0AAX4JXG7_9TREE